MTSNSPWRASCPVLGNLWGLRERIGIHVSFRRLYNGHIHFYVSPTRPQNSWWSTCALFSKDLDIFHDMFFMVERPQPSFLHANQVRHLQPTLVCSGDRAQHPQVTRLQCPWPHACLPTWRPRWPSWQRRLGAASDPKVAIQPLRKHNRWLVKNGQLDSISND